MSIISHGCINAHFSDEKIDIGRLLNLAGVEEHELVAGLFATRPEA